MKAVVGVDIDDVIYPWYHTAHQICAEADLGMASEIVPSSWSPHLEYAVSLEEWCHVLGQATLSGELHGAGPIPGALEALWELSHADVEIHLITARGFMDFPNEIKSRTMDWLSDHAVPHDGLHFTKQKVPVAKELGVTHFIDDNVGNVEAMVLHNPGAKTYLQDRPWNQETHFSVSRVANMTEFASAVLKENA